MNQAHAANPPGKISVADIKIHAENLPAEPHARGAYPVTKVTYE